MKRPSKETRPTLCETSYTQLLPSSIQFNSSTSSGSTTVYTYREQNLRDEAGSRMPEIAGRKQTWHSLCMCWIRKSFIRNGTLGPLFEWCKRRCSPQSQSQRLSAKLLYGESEEKERDVVHASHHHYKSRER